MFGPKYYVPILKGKAGELKALETAQNKGTCFRPFVEIVRKDQTFAAAATAIRTAWQTGGPLFVDAFYVEQSPPFGDEAIEQFAVHAAGVDLNIIPVTGVTRTPQQKAATSRVAAAHGSGACIRLLIDDIEEPADIDQQCDDLLGVIGLPADRVHAVVDLDAIGGQPVALLRRLVTDCIRNSAFLQSAATLTIAGSGFPQTMTGIVPHVFTPIARTEWMLWSALSQMTLPRQPTFGDYAASHPSLVDFDPETMTPAAKIIYTDSLSWLILKGRSVRGPEGYGQYRGLAAQMIARPEYRGPAFSDGDEFLNNCATNAPGSGTGNLTSWVMMKVSHHLAHVVDQLANLP